MKGIDGLSPFSVGLGFRREIARDLLALENDSVDFFEVAPENWIGVGGRYAKWMRELSERFPVTLHGLSLNIGGTAPLDTDLVKQIAGFIQLHKCPLYSEHLSYCADEGHLYDLMPIPFKEDAIQRVVDRVKQVQDILGCQIALENVSYYATQQPDMFEQEFITEVIDRADAHMLLDVNNVYVNSINHRYDPVKFMRALPKERVQYMHIAGHYIEAEDLRVDTHGAAVCDGVWRLLDVAYEIFGVKPTLLERDFNFPPVGGLLTEMQQISASQDPHRRAATHAALV